MRLIDFIVESKLPSIRNQIIADVRKHGGSPKDYFVRFTDADKLGFSARQGFGQTPDVDHPRFDIDYIGQGVGRRALWFYPLATYLNNKDVYAGEQPYVWLVKLKPTAWLQTVTQRSAKQVQPPPSGKERVGILRMSNPPAAIFFTHGYDVIGRYYNYAKTHQHHGKVLGAPKPSFFDRVRGYT